MLKDSVTPNKPDKKLNADSFAHYFKAINTPTDPFFQADEDIIQFKGTLLAILFLPIEFFLNWCFDSL